MSDCSVPDCDACASYRLHGESREAQMDRLKARFRPKVRGGTKGSRPWSRYSVRCLTCGTDERPHYSFGICRSCYDRKRKMRRAS